MSPPRITLVRPMDWRVGCRYQDTVVFSADLHEAVSANPFLEFTLRAAESGRLEFTWHEDGGAIYSLSHELTVL